MQTSKLWGRRDVLFVHFLNPDVLQGWKCGGAAMNINNILAWAGAWNTNKTPTVPEFEKAVSVEKADIRINFDGKDTPF